MGRHHREFTNRASIIAEMNSIHCNKYGYYLSVFSKATDYIDIVCESHGIFRQQISEHLRGRGCPECGMKRSLTAMQQSTHGCDLISEFERVHGCIYDYSLIDRTGLIRGSEYIPIVCKIHGIFNQRVCIHKTGSGCPRCRIEEKSYDTPRFVEKAFLVHGNRYDYSETIYVRTNKHIVVGCRIHGRFKIIPNNHLRGGGCPRCSSSKGETFVRAWLSNNGFVFEEQYAFSDFNKRMRYDFYIPSVPLIIEYDGEQHYKPVVRDGDIKSALLKLIQQKKTDAIKTKYLNSIGIPLLRIGYMDDIQETLSKRLLNAK